MRALLLLPLALCAYSQTADADLELEAIKQATTSSKAEALLKRKSPPADITDLASPETILRLRYYREKIKREASTIKQAVKESSGNSTATNAAGSLAAVSKASLQNLFGVSIERGGLTQSGEKAAATVSSSLYKLICKARNEAGTGTWLDACDPGANPLKNLTFSFSVKQLEDEQITKRPLEAISNASVRWDVFNRRDPRAHRKSDAFKNAAQKFRRFAASSINLVVALPKKCVDTAEQMVTAELKATQPEEVDVVALYSRLERHYETSGECKTVDDKTFNDLAANATQALSDYTTAVDQLALQAKATWVVALKYDFVRQYLPNDSTNKSATAPMITLPSLSSLGLNWESAKLGRLSYAGSATTTWFNNNSGSGSKLRDFRLANELELDLITAKKNPLNGLKFSLAGIFLDLRREPLGQQVELFGKKVARTGQMGTIQGKFTIPAGDSGAKIPLSFSYSTRTELLPDKEWRAGIGFTYNWRNLF
jgi:hypothetical protein